MSPIWGGMDRVSYILSMEYREQLLKRRVLIALEKCVYVCVPWLRKTYGVNVVLAKQVRQSKQ